VPDQGPVLPYATRWAAVGKVVIEYADVHAPRAFAQATCAARHGFGYQPGPFVSPMTTNDADASGIGLPGERRVGMPMPFGQFGHETSPPDSREPATGSTAAPAGPAPSSDEASSEQAASSRTGRRRCTSEVPQRYGGTDPHGRRAACPA
jgi:hypothetical protein